MKKGKLYEIKGDKAVYYVVADSEVNAEEAVCAKEKHFNYDQLEVNVVDVEEDRIYFTTAEGEDIAAKEALRETLNDNAFHEAEIIATNEFK